MAVLLNTVTIQPDGTFSFQPLWEENPVTNMPGCAPEFIGSFVYFTAGGGTISVGSFDTSTGEITGTADLNTLDGETVLFGYGFENCEAAPSSPEVNVPFVIAEANCYYSKNPINIEVETISPFNTTEIQILAEKYNGINEYVLLGTFRFISDALKFVKQDISSVLDSYCTKLLKQSVPNNDDIFEELPLHSIRFYTSSRYYDSGTWSSWVDTQASYVLYGGRGYEEVTASNLELESQFLQTNDNNFTPQVIAPAVYALIQAPGTYEWEIQNDEYNGGFAGSSNGTITTTNYWSVVKIPIDFPTDTYKSTITIELGGGSIVANLINDLYPHEQKEDFVFLSMRNGWRTLTCTGNLASVLEVAQNSYETQQQYEYYESDNIATSEVWRSLGQKRFKVATGFLSETMVDQLLQDFLLSPKKFKWDAESSKFIPVVVSSKSVEYLNSTRKGLRSFSFEYRPAFENNMTSKL